MAINNKLAKTSSASFILMLILSIVAFGYLLGSETKMISAADSATPTIKVLKSGSTTEYAQVPTEIYTAANSAANGDPAKTALLLGIWNSESGGYYNSQGERTLSWSSAKAGVQDAIGSSWFSGISPFKSVGPWEQQITNYQAYYSSVNNGKTISYSEAQKVLTSNVNEAAKSANWQIDQSITSIENKYSSAGREFSLSDPVVQEAVAMEYNAGLGKSSTAANQRVIQNLADDYFLTSAPLVIDGKNGPATYQAMAEVYNVKHPDNKIDATYAKENPTEVMNSLRAEYETINHEPAPLVAKIADTPGVADASDYAYNVERSTQAIQAQIAPSETSIGLTKELASQTAPTTGITLPPADFSSTVETHLVKDNVYTLGDTGNIDEISTQFLINSGIPESAITSEMVTSTSKDIIANNLKSSLVGGTQFDTSKVTVPTNDALNELMIQNFGYNFQDLSPADRAFLEKNGMTEADYNYIQYGELPPGNTGSGTLTDDSFISKNPFISSGMEEAIATPENQFSQDKSKPSPTPDPVKAAPPKTPSTTSQLSVAGMTKLTDGKNADGTTNSVADQVNAGAYGNAYDSNLDYYKDSSGAIFSVPKGTTTGGVQINRGTTSVWGMNMPFAVGQLAEGLTWSLAAIAAIQTLGGVFGMDKTELNALSAAATVGIMAGKLSYSILGRGGANGFLSQKSWLGQKSFLGMGGEGATGKVLSSTYFSAGVAIAAAWLTYNAMYKKSSSEIQTVNFQCLPWQAPRGGSDCELCNDGGLPCSEYRCKSLGQSCKLINEGTAVEKCINANPRDVSPPIISPWTQILTSGYRYEGKSSPPGPGVKIVANTSNGCLRAFQSIQFGVVTNEPSQCKIDIASTKNYSDMATFMGGDNLYTYNHSEFLSLPRASDFANTSITLENGKEMNLFVRCKDANGNLNSAEYVVNVCVDPTPDNTAPEIKATSIKSGNCVAANTDNTTVEFYTNEPSTCKWSFTDKDYSTMDYNMSCSSNVYEINALQLYTCSALLTGIARDGTNYYVKCEDQPNAPENERNRNMESYQFSLKGSNPLKLLSIKPNQTIYGAVRPTPVELYTQTLYGCEDNKAVCFYSLENPNNYVQFFDTDKVDGIHTQRLDLQDGQHIVYVKCVDAGGNLAENTTSFNLEIDTNSPIIARAYQEDTYLKVVTQRNSECVYTNTNCDYLFSEGTTMPYANTSTHVTPWFSDKSYYIKCRDEFRNEPTDCSMIVRPTANFL